ncbi:glycosyltransferase family 1 protein [Nitrincola tibetensis]|uniref:Glycosyltransferase family 1 protein n=1 Tax=Nitrincola tibetensis TaxID=2219697 RepID=A0A364NQC5_9GAMM|nr:glycosyltransferase [Nitrincola tibetensis]RAU19232.1 glycosyltransferase family 1 protein [Nitrincola tibetensis]
MGVTDSRVDAVCNIKHGRYIVVEEGSNPSSDFFVKPLLKRLAVDFTCYQQSDAPNISDIENSILVFVRYIPSKWKMFVDSYRHRLAGLVIFIDDDLFDIKVLASLSWGYCSKWYRFAYRHQSWLKQKKADLWVSTPYLFDKYRDWCAAGCHLTLIDPVSPYGEDDADLSLSLPIIFYHGSPSHRAEIDWLLPVFESVLQTHPQVTIELIGDDKLRRRCLKFPQIRVLHPMSWLSYQRMLKESKRLIGLAPLLDTKVNAARAPTKYFDITAAGAVGVYSDSHVYRQLVTHKVNGLLVEMDQEAWVAAITSLIDDAQQRRALLAEVERS